MIPFKITPVLLLALALSAQAQEPVVIQKSVTNGNTVSTFSYSAAGGVPAPEFRRMLEDVQIKAQAAQDAGMAASGGFGVVGPGGNAFAIAASGRKASAPTLLMTRAFDATTRADWQEDLRVMDKLLRDQLASAEGDAVPHAMGIRLLVTDNGPREPVLVEDYGMVFSYEAGFPLAESPNPRPARKREGQPNSAWERARREVQGSARPGAGAGPRRTLPPMNAAYDAAKVEALVDALAAVLPEARNIRHLDGNAVVLVSVSGVDSAGTPVRLTLKATRSDLEKAAGGDAAAAEFRKALAWSVQ